MNRLFGVAAAVLLAVPAVANAQGIGVEAAGIYASLSGDDFQTTDAGFGFDAQLRLRTPGRLSLGAGLQYTSHNDDSIGESVGVLGVFAEPRLSFSVPASPITPFIGGRVGYLRRSVSAGGTDASSSGWLYGGTGGVTFRGGPMVDLMVAVVFAGASFSDYEVNGQAQTGTDASGSALAVRAGVSIKLGR